MTMIRCFFPSAILFGMTAISNAQWSYANLHPAGAGESYIEGIHSGLQVGYAAVGGGFRCSLWSGTAASWIDISPAGAQAIGTYANLGQQVGYAGIGGTTHAGFWSGSSASWVDLHPAGSTQSLAYGLGGGKQSGFAVIGGVTHAGLWSGTAGSFVDLHPTGASESKAFGLDGAQQSGSARAGGILRACLWTGTAASIIDLSPAGATESEIEAASGGQQVGRAVVGGVTRASLWTGSAASWVDLHPAGSSESYVYGVEGAQQAGRAKISGAFHAGIWSGTAASWVDLHNILPTNFNESHAQGIWHDAQGVTFVVGYAYNTTTTRNEAIMWVRQNPNDFALSLNKSSVAGQNSVLGTITMVETKPANTVFTTYDNSSLVTTPPNVTVLAGQLSRNFQITVTAITSTVNTTIYATRGILTRTQPLTLIPLVPTALSFTPNPVTGGMPTSCRIVMNGVAGPGGRLVATFDNSAYAVTPNSVTVPAGASSVTFPIMTVVVTSIKYVTVTARVSAVDKTGTFRINP